MQIRAVPGRRVRHPESGELVTDEPTTVEQNSFWLRRLQDGDVEIVNEDPARPPQPKAS